MSNEMQYTVIRNNERLINKHEVWCKGEMTFPNSQGFLEKRHAARMIKVFRSESAAQDFVTYQKELRAFRGEL